MKITISANFFNIILAGIAFGIWQNSYWAGIALLFFLTVLDWSFINLSKVINKI